MNKIDALLDIKYEALYLEQRLIDGMPAGFPKIEQAFSDLIDRFYGEGDGLITAGQYEAARSNWDYFIILVDLALAHYKEEQ